MWLHRSRGRVGRKSLEGQGELLPSKDRLMPDPKEDVAPTEALTGSLRDYREPHGPDLLGRRAGAGRGSSDRSAPAPA